MRVRIVLGRGKPAPEGNPFLLPLPHPVRAAVLAPGFAETRRVRLFPGGWSREIEEYRPELLAAPLSGLRGVAALAAARRIDLPSLDCVVVFTGHGQPALTGADRDLFWRAFEVPLFEQFLDAEGRVAAAECDAHDGLHILLPGFPSSEWECKPDLAPCRCGRPGPRVSGLCAKTDAGARAFAAAAG